MVKRKHWITRCLPLAAAALVVACITAFSNGGAAVASSSTASASAAKPVYGGTLRMQMLRDTTTNYDPATSTESTVFTVDGLIFDTLLQVSPTGALEPLLATHWTVSPNGLTYTFTLRSGVKFQNGMPMTSADVKYTIQRIQDPATLSPDLAEFAAVKSIETPNPTTVILQLSQRDAPLLADLADIPASIVPMALIQSEGEAAFGNDPVGTGPFRLKQWVRDESVTLVANKSYWQKGLPYLSAVDITFNSDTNAALADIESGSINFLWNAPPQFYKALKEDSGVRVYGGYGSTTFQYFEVNMQKAPFNKLLVRQAIFQALNREQIRLASRPYTTTLLNGGFFPSTYWAALKTTVWKQDIPKAKADLAKAGYANGFDMTIIALTGSDFHIEAAEVIQQQLAKIGIKASIQVVDAATQETALETGNFEGVVSGFSGTIDPDQRFTQTFETGGGTNYAKFSNAEVDKLIAEARLTDNTSQRAKLYREAQLIITKDGPMYFTYNYNYYDVMASNVHGYVYNPTTVNYRSIGQMWISR